MYDIGTFENDDAVVICMTARYGKQLHWFAVEMNRYSFGVRHRGPVCSLLVHKPCPGLQSLLQQK